MSARPHVVVHSLTSADGRLAGFPADLGLYYGLAAAIPHQAILTGSGTMLAAAQAEGVDLSGEDRPGDAATSRGANADEEATPPDDRPVLVVVDSRGRLTRYDWLRQAPFWRDVRVLGAASTPGAHRDRLARAGVRVDVVGVERVDLAAALGLLAGEGVEAIRVDAGPGLLGALLDAGLVDEVSLVVAPHLVGDGRLLLDGLPNPVPLRLLTAEPLGGDHIHLRYAVALLR